MKYVSVCVCLCVCVHRCARMRECTQQSEGKSLKGKEKTLSSIMAIMGASGLSRPSRPIFNLSLCFIYQPVNSGHQATKQGLVLMSVQHPVCSALMSIHLCSSFILSGQLVEIEKLFFELLSSCFTFWTCFMSAKRFLTSLIVYACVCVCVCVCVYSRERKNAIVWQRQ